MSIQLAQYFAIFYRCINTAVYICVIRWRGSLGSGLHVPTFDLLDSTAIIHHMKQELSGDELHNMDAGLSDTLKQTVCNENTETHTCKS